MSLSSFRVQQDATGQMSSAWMEKVDEHPPPRGCGRMSLSSFRVQQDANGQQSSASTDEKGDERVPKTRHADVVGKNVVIIVVFVHQDATGQQSSASTEKI
ncbi:hypothetical protein TNCV_1065061 [Trichonephila clavipes]|nr:hypothetical protein TNCV_1065061 [Trichonephila clavipes]